MNLSLETVAVVMPKPEHIELQRLELSPPSESDVVVDIQWSSISTGTERLLWAGEMPDFPGMGYPLVPGYESVGKVIHSGADAKHRVDETVFVPGANCYGSIRGLFGGAASRVVVPGERVLSVPGSLGENAVMLALAATAQHALKKRAPQGKTLIIGHGVLGRLLARLILALGYEAPVVWENSKERLSDAQDYRVMSAEEDESRDYATIYDVSGDETLVDELISRLTANGELVLVGFYRNPVAFTYPPAFQKEISIHIAAEWKNADLSAVSKLVQEKQLSLDGLISHKKSADKANEAYEAAFCDPTCLKMVLDWRNYS